MPPLEIEFLPRFRATARALPPDRQQQVAQAVTRLGAAIGRSHLHSGLGIRRLKRDYFEFRAGRDIRIVFKLEGSTARLLFAGNHDDVRNFLKGA